MLSFVLELMEEGIFSVFFKGVYSLEGSCGNSCGLY